MRHTSTAFRAVGIVTAVGAAIGVLNFAYAQQTGSITPDQTTPPQWSGLSGSSGHPLMTAEAIRTAAAEFPNCLERMWPDAARRGVSRTTFEIGRASCRERV